MAVVRATPPPVWLRGFVDGLGRRAVAWTEDAGAAEVLRLSPRLGGGAACASALTEASTALASLHHPALRPGPVVEPLADGAPAVVSSYVAGERLVDLLDRTSAAGTALPTSAVLFALRELVGAVRVLHAAGRCHGAISPERVLVTPDQRVVLLDHALGGLLADAVDQGPEELWAGLAIAVPTVDGLPAFSPLTDQLQLGLTALAMLLGRPLRADEYPGEIAVLLDDAQETDLVGARAKLSPMLREWLSRTLLVSSNGPFPSIEAAEGDLEIMLSEDSGYVAAPLGIDVRPAALEPLSEDEVASFGLVLPPSAAPEDVEPAPRLPEPADRFAQEEPETAASAPLDTSTGDDEPRTAAEAGRPALSLVPAPDPTANSERILELAHGLEGSRARRSAAQGGSPQGPADAAGLPVTATRTARRRVGAWSARAAVAGAGSVILLMAGIAAGAYYVVAGGPRSAHLRVESDPAGARVVLEGTTLGRTPVDLSLPRGAYVLEIQGQHSSQSLPVVIGAGERRTERVTLPEAGPPGRLVITTEPAGAPVSVDGTPRGTGPLSVQVAPGRHVVTAANEFGQARREVEVQSGGWVQVPLAVSGWIELITPVPVRATISGKPAAAGETRFAVAPGRHRVEFVNDEIGLRDSQDVIVHAGRTTQVTVTGTTGVLEITSSAANAAVWVDGTLAGRAPLTLTIAPGRHDIKFVHAELGELRYEVFVKMGSSFLHGDFGAAPRPTAARTPARRR